LIPVFASRNVTWTPSPPRLKQREREKRGRERREGERKRRGREKERERERVRARIPPMLQAWREDLFVSRKEEEDWYSRIKLITTQRYEAVDTRASNLDQGSRRYYIAPLLLLLPSHNLPLPRVH
jgi:hypothetical protein